LRDGATQIVIAVISGRLTAICRTIEWCGARALPASAETDGFSL
jgi:hypothetical protein